MGQGFPGGQCTTSDREYVENPLVFGRDFISTY